MGLGEFLQKYLSNGTFHRLLGGDKILPKSSSWDRPQRVAQVFRLKLQGNRYFWMNDLNIQVLTWSFNKT